MKIIMTARGYLSLTQEKYGLFEIDQARALNELGHEVCVFAIDMRSIRHIRKWGLFETQKEGVSIINISFPCYGISEKIKIKICRCLLQKAYKMYCKKNNVPDIIHAHFFEYAYYIVSAFQKNGIPIIVTEHSSLVNVQKMDDKMKKKARIAYENAHKVIAVSGALANRIEQHFGIKCCIVPNVVDVDIFNYKKREIKSEKFIFITVANLIPIKRIDILIKAYAKLMENYQNGELIIVGDGEEKSKLIQLAIDYKIQNKVIFKGRLERKSISELMASADCFVLPSSSETFGVAYIEAMASGLPVIATRCGGPEDFVNESNGILVDIDNIEDLYQAMVAMINQVNKYDAKEISDTVRTLFSKEIVGKRIMEEYKN